MPLADPTSEYTAAQARRGDRGGSSSLVHCCAGHHRGAAAAAAAAFRSQHDEDGRHTQKRTKLRLLCS